MQDSQTELDLWTVLSLQREEMKTASLRAMYRYTTRRRHIYLCSEELLFFAVLSKEYSASTITCARWWWQWGRPYSAGADSIRLASHAAYG